MPGGYSGKFSGTRGAKGYRPTNGDRIRSMSDEELARFLAEVENRRSAAGGGAIWCGAAHALDWLRQEVRK